MGGTVKLITNQPNLTESHASVESILSGTDGGGFNHNDNFMFNLPMINDRLALRIVGSEAYTSGWIDRIVADPFPLPTNGGADPGQRAGRAGAWPDIRDRMRSICTARA